MKVVTVAAVNWMVSPRWVDSLSRAWQATVQAIGVTPHGAPAPKELVLLRKAWILEQEGLDEWPELSNSKENQQWLTSVHDWSLVGPRCSTWQTRQ